MRNFIYAIGVCSLLFSCNSELETLPEEFNTEGTAPLVTRVAAHPKYGVLGWGYDVTGNYMSHGKGVTLPVIDIDRFEAENFDRIVLDSSTSQETEYYYGTTAEEYLKRVGDNVDTGVDAKKALFSLTITGNYQKNTSYSSEYSFAGCDHYYSLKRCYIRAAVERLQNYLSDTFREDLAELPAEDIVDFYGTHVLADIRMGGRVSFLYKTYAGKENVEAITKAGFKVNVLNLFSIGNEYQVNTSLAVNFPGNRRKESFHRYSYDNGHKHHQKVLHDKITYGQFYFMTGEITDIDSRKIQYDRNGKQGNNAA
mgnify:CR=1 FL=1